MENTTKNLKKPAKPSKESKPAERSKQKGSDTGTEPSKEKKKRDFNIMTDMEAAEARAVLRRTETDKAHKIRLALLEDYKLSSQDKMEEISKRWPSTKQKVGVQTSLLQQQQQQQMFEQLLNQTRQFSLQLSQELKASGEHFVAQSKKQTDYLQLMLERMIEQDQSVTRAHREKLAQWKESVQKEEEAKHTVDKNVWDRGMASLVESEEKKLLSSQQAVDEFDFQMHQQMFDFLKNFYLHRNMNMAVFQSLALELHQVTSERMSIEQKVERLTAENNKLNDKYKQTKAKLSVKLTSLSKGPGDEKHKQLMDKELKKLKCKVQDYECLQRKTLHFLLANAMKFENMWLTLDEEVKELLERALYLDSTIYQQVLHLPWEQPELNGTKLWRRWDEASTLSQSSQCSQEQNEDRQNQETHSEAVERSSTLTPRTVHRLMEILCEEAGFLIEVKIANELQSLDENEHTRIKANYLFNTLGINDPSQLVDFLCKYGQQSSRHSVEAEAAEPWCFTGEVKTSPTTPVTSDPIDPTDVLQALSFFIDHHNESRSRDKWSVQNLEFLDVSKEEAYWESLSSAITAHKLRMWEGAERSLQLHHAVLRQMSELLLEVQSFQQENSELKMVLMGLQEQCLD